MNRPLDRILVAVDFGEESIAAARWAARDLAPEAEIVLLYVVDLPRPPVFLAHITPEPKQIEASARQGAEERLREVAASVEADRIRTEVRVGRPAAAIAAAVQELDVDVVVLGPHGGRRGLGRALGATADQLLRHCTVPVVVARTDGYRPPRVILLPMDSSEHSAHAARWAVTLAERTGARLVGVHVVDPALYGSLRTIQSVLRADQLRRRVQDATEEWIRNRLARAGAREPEARAVLGEPRSEILAAIEREGADLVVMGTRGAGGVGRAVLGSLASALAREAPCPLFLVTAREGDRQAADR